MTVESSTTPSSKKPNTTVTSTLNHINLISFNATAQLPVKLTSENYSSWKAKFDALLFGYDLLGFINGTKPCPPAMIIIEGEIVSNPECILWKQQDKVLFHGIIASLSDRVLP
ncbi:hypothetical protein Dsin_018792 [Dipteronia sinensis]|uniref:Retrotransposon Copia-like N-terminal domain-containing protein n=1 Tax=Dipteronia sinensis TaxID=43782 RepID=A0AAE0E2E2_9ROSI|nr:hypothetical protein Dsin_018792 [Dipteronia sinensis]